MIGTLITLASYLVVLMISESCYRLLRESLISRKIAHIGAGIVTATLPYFVTLHTALCFSVLFTILFLLSQRYRLIRSVYDHEDGLGTLYFPIGMGIAAFLFWGTPQIFSGAALLFAIPDGVSGYIGKRFGHREYSLTGVKTLEGSAAFCVIAFLVFLGWAIFFDATLNVPLLAFGIITAFSLTLVEGALGRGLDNLLLPVVAGTLLGFLV